MPTPKDDRVNAVPGLRPSPRGIEMDKDVAKQRVTDLAGELGLAMSKAEYAEFLGELSDDFGIMAEGADMEAQEESD